MPTRLFTSSSGTAFSPEKNASLPCDGLVNCATILRSVVLPDPLCPTSATHSPGSISSEIPRSARRIPYRFSMSLNCIRRPLPGTLADALAPWLPEEVGCGVATRDRSALNQIAQQLLRATALQCIFLVGDGSSLAPQFESKQSVFERVQIGIHFALNSLDGRSREGWWSRCDLGLCGLCRALSFAALRSWRRRRSGHNLRNWLTHEQRDAYGENRREPAQ